MSRIERYAWAAALALLVPAIAWAAPKLFFKEQAVTNTGVTIAIVDSISGGDASAFNADVVTVCNDGANDVWVSPRSMPSPSPAPTGFKVVADGPCVKIPYDKSDTNKTVYSQVGWANLYAKTASGESATIQVYASAR